MRKKIILSFLWIVLMFGPLTSKAASVFEGEQTGASRTNLELEGGYVEQLAVTPDGVVFAALNSPNGIFYSTDGETWNGPPEGSDFGSPIAVVASEEGVFTVGGISLFRTQDNGVSWEALTGSRGDPLANNYGQTMTYGNGRLFVPVRDGTIDISDDEGDTFTNVEVDDEVTSVTFVGAAETTDEVYALVSIEGQEDRVVYKSADGGETWAATDISGNYSAVYVDPTDENHIIFISNNGAAHTSTGITGTISELTNFSGDVIFNGDRIHVGINYTDDGGATWHTFGADESVSELGNNAIAIDPNNPDIIYLDTMVGVAVSTDDGETWANMNAGMMGVQVSNISQANDKDTVWIATQQGFAKSLNFTDNNPIWSFPLFVGENESSTEVVWVDPDNADHVIVSENGVLYNSTNGGASWTNTNTSITNGGFSDIFQNETTLYATYSSNGGTEAAGGVLQSTDNGTSWSDLGFSGAQAGPLTADSSGNLYVGVGSEWLSDDTNRGVYKYNGTAWAQLTGAIEGYLINDIIVVDDVIFAAGGETSRGGVFRSADGGATWSDLTANGLAQDGWYHALTYDPNNPEILYVSTARPAGTGYIYKSMDGGDSWDIFYTGLKDETFNAMIYDGLVAGTNVGLFEIQSNVKLSLKAAKNKIKKNRKVKLTVRLKDAATDEDLDGKLIKIYAKQKLNKKWVKVSQKRTDTGTAVFHIKLKKGTYFQASWKPASSADQESYGTEMQKTNQIRVSIKKK